MNSSGDSDRWSHRCWVLWWCSGVFFTNAPVVLVAGGIGITPVISVFQAALKANVQDVTLIWVIRNISYRHGISQLLEDFRARGHSSTVNVIVHVTRGTWKNLLCLRGVCLTAKVVTNLGACLKEEKGERHQKPPSGRRVLIKSGRRT